MGEWGDGGRPRGKRATSTRDRGGTQSPRPPPGTYQTASYQHRPPERYSARVHPESHSGANSPATSGPCFKVRAANATRNKESSLEKVEKVPRDSHISLMLC
ncbi:hypothetical protein chiPu_0001182 [Chiloscyllium punctatum]|uniref:Uncharacterized protein n=1 Tax=Chiloscyllium punctatum TaxID=137246 RepID=A0A401RXC7_CHIPU|nr:hypothetical protein [Chiloscyllium punctatum]